MTRRKNDQYFTNEHLTLALLEREQISGSIMEPCCGAGDIANVLRRKGCLVFDSDIDPRYGTGFACDATKATADCWQFSPDWVITNPPFNQASKILPLALNNCRIGVAFLLRLSYMEPTNGRGQWLIDHADQMTRLMTFNPRPCFRSGEINPKTGKQYGTDNVTVSWFVWRKEWSWEKLGIPCPFEFITDWRN